MVQLKEMSANSMSLDYMFQFQYGAAESPHSSISFQFAFVSIPVWCSWKSFLISSLSRIDIVSIPVWCSWKKGYWVCLPIHLRKFQFQYGAAERKKGFDLKDHVPEFQFQYGAAERAKASPDTRTRIRVSIPVWCSWKSYSEPMRVRYLSFNSSMVQLKEEEEASKEKELAFQFQYGAAESSIS